MKNKIPEILMDGTIDKACSGDTEAIRLLLRHFDPYINSLSLRPLETPDGQIILSVNDDIKEEVRIHLIKKMLQFDCSRYD